MGPLVIGSVTLTVTHPHVLDVIGYVGSTQSSAPHERISENVGYLGLCLRGDSKPPHRSPGESLYLYGRRVYDHLVGLGGTPKQIMDWGNAAAREAIDQLPPVPAAEEVAEAGKSSGGEGSEPVSSSPTDTGAMPSSG